MKNMIKKVFVIAVSFCLVLVSSMTVLAADTNNGFDVELYAEKN